MEDQNSVIMRYASSLSNNTRRSGNSKKGLIKRAKEQMENLEQDIKYKTRNKNDQDLSKLASETLKYSYGAER